MQTNKQTSETFNASNNVRPVRLRPLKFRGFLITKDRDPSSERSLRIVVAFVANEGRVLPEFPRPGRDQFSVCTV
jgi:hypothetical protein